MREHFKHWHAVTVRWGDMDAMGHVNNATYFTYCESARISYFDAVRMWEHRAHDREGPALVSATLNFRQQVHYPAELEVGLRARELGNRSFTLAYEIYRRGTDELVAEGGSVVAWVDYEAGKSIPLPDGLRAAIRQLEAMAGDLGALS
jgi:acyl-CoA thioester hydrolase